jgi:hypothetical protein
VTIREAHNHLEKPVSQKLFLFIPTRNFELPATVNEETLISEYTLFYYLWVPAK